MRVFFCTAVATVVCSILSNVSVAQEQIEKAQLKQAQIIAHAEVARFANATKFALNRAVAHQREEWRRFDSSSVPPLFRELGQQNKDLGEATAYKYLTLLVDAYRRKTHLASSNQNGLMRAAENNATASEILHLIENAHPVLDTFTFPLYEELKKEDLPKFVSNTIGEFADKVRLIDPPTDFTRRFGDIGKCRGQGWFRFNFRLKPEQRRELRSTQFAHAFERLDRALALSKSVNLESIPEDIRDLWGDQFDAYKDYHAEAEKIVAAPFLQALTTLGEDDAEGKLAVLEAAAVLSPRLVASIVSETGKTLSLTDKSDPLRTARLARLRAMINSAKPTPPLKFSKGKLGEFNFGITLADRPRGLEISEDGKRLVAVTKSATEVFDLEAGRKLFEIDPTSEMTRVSGLPFGRGAVFWGDDYQVASLHAMTTIALSDSSGKLVRQLKVDPPKPKQLVSAPTGELMVGLPNGIGMYDYDGNLTDKVELDGGASFHPFADGTIVYRHNRATYRKKIGSEQFSILYGFEIHPTRFKNQDYRQLSLASNSYLIPTHPTFHTITFPVECNAMLSAENGSRLFLSPSQTKMCQVTGLDQEVLISELPSLNEIAYFRTEAWAKPVWIDEERLLTFGGNQLAFVDLNKRTVKEFEFDFRFHDKFVCSSDHRHFAFVVTTHDRKISVAKLSLDQITEAN